MTSASRLKSLPGASVSPHRSTFRTAWALTRPYFSVRGGWAAWLLVGGVVAATVFETWGYAELSGWNRRFFNALQALDRTKFSHELVMFLLFDAAIIVAWQVQFYCSNILRLRWRRWLTVECMDLWMRGQAYYRMQWTDANTDNPDQRISEDINAFVDKTVTIFSDILRSILGLVSFLVILWRLSGTFEAHLPYLGLVRIHGYLVWGAIAYAGAATFVIHRLGIPLVDLSFRQEAREADFRFALVRLRENAESIALYSAEPVERVHLDGRFAALLANTRHLIVRRLVVGAASNFYDNASSVIPYLLVAPRFFARLMTVGEVVQTASAFGTVQGYLSVVIANYQTIAEWRATIARIAGFASAVREVRVVEQAQGLRRSSRAGVRLTNLTGLPAVDHTVSNTHEIVVVASRDATLRVCSVATSSPAGEDLGAATSFEVAPGERLLLSGPSGCGKTTLVRAIAGIWPHGSGTIERPQVRALFLSQRPYLPLGTLRDALCYPQPPSDVMPAAVETALQRVGLGHLGRRLDDPGDWSHVLSLGEQQRIAFARVLLLRPGMVVLDEATSALDVAAEKDLYEVLEREAPNAILVSVGHHTTLQAFHTRRAEVGGKRSEALR